MVDKAFPALTDRMVELARKTISAQEKVRPACFSVMTDDVVRRWCYAIGDVNPLWLDKEYGAQSRWGSHLVPPTFPETAVRGPVFNPSAYPRDREFSRDEVKQLL